MKPWHTPLQLHSNISSVILSWSTVTSELRVSESESITPCFLPVREASSNNREMRVLWAELRGRQIHKLKPHIQYSGCWGWCSLLLVASSTGCSLGWWTAGGSAEGFYIVLRWASPRFPNTESGRWGFNLWFLILCRQYSRGVANI